MGHLAILAISVVLIAAAVCGDEAPEAVDQSPVNKAAYTVWFPAEPTQDQNATVLIGNGRVIYVSENNDEMKSLASFIKDNIQNSKMRVKGKKKNIRINVNGLRVIELYSLVKVGQRRNDRILQRLGTFDVENPANSVVEAQSQSYNYHHTQTESITVSKTVGFSGTITFPLKLLNNFTPTVTFSRGYTSAKTESIERSVTIPSQKVVLNPHSKRKLIHNLFREELLEDYRATFLVDPTSKFRVGYKHIIKRAKDPYLMAFLKEMYEKHKEINIPDMEYNYNNQILLMKDYPVTRSIINDIVKMEFGTEERLK